MDFFDVCVEDGTTTVFFDALNYDNMNSEKVRSFFKFLCGLDIKDNFTEKLSALVERLKMNVQQRQDYMTWEQELKIQSKEIAEKIAKQFAQESVEKTAKNFLLKGIEPDIIAECTGLPLEQVLELQKEVTTNAAN